MGAALDAEHTAARTDAAQVTSAPRHALERPPDTSRGGTGPGVALGAVNQAALLGAEVAGGIVFGSLAMLAMSHT